MGKGFFRLVEAAIASGALIVPGYAIAGDSGSQAPKAGAAAQPAKAPNEGSTPTIKSARLDRSGLTIQFSAPLSSSTAVDPNKFRLTFAYYRNSRPGSYSYYYEYYGAARPITVYSDVGRVALKSRIEQPRPAELRIPASAELRLSSLCGEIAGASDEQKQAGLYLHYDQGGSPRVESASGEALGSIAPFWLSASDASVTQGALPGRPIPVDVSCPKEAPQADDGADRHRH